MTANEILDIATSLLALLGLYRVGRRAVIIVYFIWKDWGVPSGPWLGMRPWSY